jgi:hypothetical protein
MLRGSELPCGGSLMSAVPRPRLWLGLWVCRATGEWFRVQGSAPARAIEEPQYYPVRLLHLGPALRHGRVGSPDLVPGPGWRADADAT